MAFVTDHVQRLVEVVGQPGLVVKAFPPRCSQPEVVLWEAAAQLASLRPLEVKTWVFQRCPIDWDPVAASKFAAAVRERRWAIVEPRPGAEPEPSRAKEVAARLLEQR